MDQTLAPWLGVDDAAPTTLAPTFHTLVVQPTTLCNLNCEYCYLPDRKVQRRMPIAVAEACASSIRQQASPHPVEVVWHGGEPTAVPIGHLRSLLAPFEDLRRAGAVRHGIQTNATLIDQRWCNLFAEYDFTIGVSVDGPEWANEARRDYAGRATFARVERGVEHLRRSGLDFTVICVVTPETIERADDLIEFFTHYGCRSVGFNLEEQEGAGRPALASGSAYQFWRRLIQRRLAGSSLPVRDLDHLAAYLATAQNGVCDDRAVEPLPTVAYNGDTVLLSPELLGIRDDRYGDFLAGNVLRATIAEMLASSDRLRYVTEFAAALRACAATCEFFDFCRGAQAGNRYFEHGTFSITETAHCRNTRQALIHAAIDELTERR